MENLPKFFDILPKNIILIGLIGKKSPPQRSKIFTFVDHTRHSAGGEFAIFPVELPVDPADRVRSVRVIRRPEPDADVAQW